MWLALTSVEWNVYSTKLLTVSPGMAKVPSNIFDVLNKIHKIL